jgi:arylsulfatase A
MPLNHRDRETLLRNEQVVERPAGPSEWTRLHTDEAIEFIRRHQERPWFVCRPHTMFLNPLLDRDVGFRVL